MGTTGSGSGWTSSSPRSRSANRNAAVSGTCTPSMPTRRAASAFSARSSQNTVIPAECCNTRSARRNEPGAGLAIPIRADDTTASTSVSSPSSRRSSGSLVVALVNRATRQRLRAWRIRSSASGIGSPTRDHAVTADRARPRSMPTAISRSTIDSRHRSSVIAPVSAGCANPKPMSASSPRGRWWASSIASSGPNRRSTPSRSSSRRIDVVSVAAFACRRRTWHRPAARPPGPGRRRWGS